jgi:hypothetical protein
MEMLYVDTEYHICNMYQAWEIQNVTYGPWSQFAGEEGYKFHEKNC